MTFEELEDKLKTVELKPCPFCGAKAKAYCTDDDWRDIDMKIICTGDCYAEMHRWVNDKHKMYVNEESVQGLINYWNSRV